MEPNDCNLNQSIIKIMFLALIDWNIKNNVLLLVYDYNRQITELDGVPITPITIGWIWYTTWHDWVNFVNKCNYTPCYWDSVKFVICLFILIVLTLLNFIDLAIASSRLALTPPQWRHSGQFGVCTMWKNVFSVCYRTRWRKNTVFVLCVYVKAQFCRVNWA